jgi:hypothetical protein
MECKDRDIRGATWHVLIRSLAEGICKVAARFCSRGGENGGGKSMELTERLLVVAGNDAVVGMQLRRHAVVLIGFLFAGDEGAVGRCRARCAGWRMGLGGMEVRSRGWMESIWIAQVKLMTG